MPHYDVAWTRENRQLAAYLIFKAIPRLIKRVRELEEAMQEISNEIDPYLDSGKAETGAIPWLFRVSCLVSEALGEEVKT